ncbi:hypothetical protein FRC06_003529 [Ceratobasidium sp. 370]|nr:hypothetical protein FRC06_003529 [Ceratobasidium sp. 370]
MPDTAGESAKGAVPFNVTFTIFYIPSLTVGDTRAASKPPTATKRHSKFYFDNTLVAIQIEDTLFNVHKYQLMKSETFSDMFKVAQENSEQGPSPENPIVIEGVAVSDFESLLTVLYAPHFSPHMPAPEASLIIPAFRLATKWDFGDLKSYLLPLAEKELDAVDRIAFAREFGITEWLAPAHTELCQRTQPITTEEAVKIGARSLLAILQLREASYCEEQRLCFSCCYDAYD